MKILWLKSIWRSNCADWKFKTWWTEPKETSNWTARGLSNRWSSSKMRSNTSWTRRALTRRRARTQTWRFYPGGLKCRHVIFSISSEGGDRIKERFFAGSIRRRRRSETMRELRWTWEGRAAAEIRLCWCSRGFLCRWPTILIFPVCEMMF